MIIYWHLEKGPAMWWLMLFPGYLLLSSILSLSLALTCSRKSNSLRSKTQLWYIWFIRLRKDELIISIPGKMISWGGKTSLWQELMIVWNNIFYVTFTIFSQKGHSCIKTTMKRITAIVYWKKFEKRCEIVYKRM